MSIDSRNTKAIDDCFSIEHLQKATEDTEDVWKIGIHISDVDCFVKQGSHLDKEAVKRVESMYMGKYFFRPMLPHDLYSDLCSLIQGKKRPVVSVYFNINKDGMIDFDSVEYELSVITNQKQMTHGEANRIIEEEDSSEVGVMLKQLNELMQKRYEFRSSLCKTDYDDE